MNEMKNGWKLATVMLAVAVVALASALALLWHHVHGGASSSGGEGGKLAHVSNAFEFVLHAPMATVAPLFGAEGEKAWGGREWQPEFLYPSSDSATKDVEGAVFQLRHGQRKVPWVNTAFDPAGGHIAYVYLIDGHLVTRIDIHLAEQDADKKDARGTRVKVLYERTALSPAANDHVAELGRTDAGSGPEWQADLETYLKTAGSRKSSSRDAPSIR